MPANPAFSAIVILRRLTREQGEERCEAICRIAQRLAMRYPRVLFVHLLGALVVSLHRGEIYRDTTTDKS